jgi:hypothetical protein
VTLSEQTVFINHSDFLQNKALFYDNLHVNNTGRAACSADFALQLKAIISDVGN